MLRTLIATVCLLCAPALAQSDFPPPDHPESWGLAIVDVETTGLDAGHHEMIDLGAIYTDLDGNELGRFFVRITPDHPERAGEIARSINGFDEARWSELDAVGEAEAVADFLAFHAAATGSRTMIFTAYNAHFDRAFLDALLREHGSGFREHFSYYMLDLPSLAWGAGIPELRNGEVAIALGLEPETDDPLEHTGLSGAVWNLALYRALKARIAERSDAVAE